SDHSPYSRITAVPTARGTPGFDKLAEMFVERSAGHGHVLELTRRGIGRFHEHKQATAVLLRLLNKRHDPVTPQKGIDGQRIYLEVPWHSLFEDLDGAQKGLRIAHCSGAN